MIRIAAHQLAPAIADLPANETMSLEAVRRSVADGAQLVVLPELTLSGYMLSSPEEARGVAVGVEHPIFAAWADAVAAAGAVVVAGFSELGEDGCVYNSAAVVDGSGVRAVYRKTHLWDRETLIFTAGTVAPPVVDTSVGRLGVIVCYDLEFPEMTRGLALGGAELIVVPTNWPLGPRPAGERPPEMTIAMATARVNRVGVVCCDRSGTERGQRWTQGTCIVDERGWILAATERDGDTAVAELDPRLARDKSFTDLADAFADRRPELYGALTAPASPRAVSK